MRETVKRLSALTDDEVELLVDATASERGHLMWAAACRRYDLIGEFAEEVLRERFLLLASTLEYEDFDSFIRTKALWHEELADHQGLDAAEAEVKRVQDAAGGRAAVGGGLHHACRVVRASRCLLSARTPSDMRFFPTTDGRAGGRREPEDSARAGGAPVHGAQRPSASCRWRA